MASILVLVIMAGCAALMFFKCSLIKSFAAFAAALCASFVAFGWYERLADFIFISRDMAAAWGQLISFISLFAITFAILQAIVIVLVRHPVNLGQIPESVGRAIFGLALGLIISGVLLITVSLSPLSNSYPYARYPYGTPDPENPAKALLNPDGFLTGWFSISSSGPLSGAKSFGVVHADFLNQLYFSRYKTGKYISVLAPSGSVRVPNKAAAWPAPQGLKDTDGKPVASKSGRELIIVRTGLTSAFVRKGGVFIPAQFGLICKEKDDKGHFEGSAEVIYPAGFLNTSNQLDTKRPDEEVTVKASDLKDGVKWFDFAFYVPTELRPVAISFKENIIVEVPEMVTAEQAPE